MNILEAIEARKSERTYRPEPLGEDEKKTVKEAIARAYSPFPGECTIELHSVDMEEDFHPSTYGVIRGARDFLLMGIAGDDASYITAGFKMEQVVLAATQLGLGTCWMAATFKNTEFEKVADFPEGQALKVVSPIGVNASERRFLEKFTRFTLGSKNRKPFERLFFVENWETPCTDSDMFYESLQMLRLAPSSTNSQPWRALIKGATVYFYCKSRGDVSLIDMGIGMCHFAITESFRNHDGTWQLGGDHPKAAPGLTYVGSYTRR